MPKTRRLIRAQRPYELILRVEQGLPFAAISLMKLLIEGIIARTQRDQKVIICHYLWMGNHVHLIIIAQDPQQCMCFYQELQKKITDTIKRLLGKHKLSLWEGDPVLAEILDPDALVERIAYLYANPANADLVDAIDDFPGISTWNDFQTVGCDHKCSLTSEVPWVQLPSIKPLPSLTLSRIDDEMITSRLKASATIKHELIIQPNAWQKCFNIGPADSKYYFERVISSVRKREDDARLIRQDKGKSVLGRKNLRSIDTKSTYSQEKRTKNVCNLID